MTVEQDDHTAPGCVAEIEAPPGGLFFAETMEGHPRFSGRFGFYQHGSETVRSLLRTDSVEYGVLEDRVRSDPTVRSVSYLRTLNGEHIYDVELNLAPECPLIGLSGDIELFRGTGEAGRWRIVLWFSSAALLEDCLGAAERQGLGWETVRLYGPSGPSDPLAELTPVQRETLEMALAVGYFDIPRGASMQELADELGVTPNAVSERLRRAERKVLSTLLVREPT